MGITRARIPYGNLNVDMNRLNPLELKSHTKGVCAVITAPDTIAKMNKITIADHTIGR